MTKKQYDRLSKDFKDNYDVILETAVRSEDKDLRYVQVRNILDMIDRLFDAIDNGFDE